MMASAIRCGLAPASSKSIRLICIPPPPLPLHQVLYQRFDQFLVVWFQLLLHLPEHAADSPLIRTDILSNEIRGAHTEMLREVASTR